MPFQFPLPAGPRHLGILQILFSGFCFGFLGLFGKWAFSLGLDTGAFLCLRFLMASATLFLWLLMRDPQSLRLGFSSTLIALLLGIFGYALFSFCYFSALRGLSVSLTVLLLYTCPVWVALGGHFLFGENLQRRQWWALPLATIGLTLLLWGELQVREPAFLGLGLLAALLYSGYILASRAFLREVPAAATALVGTVFAISFFLSGLQKLLSAEASILSLAEPCTAIFLGAVAFGENLGALQWLGAILILSSLSVVVLAGGKETA